jgi:pyruvate,water dikinase
LNSKFEQFIIASDNHAMNDYADKGNGKQGIRERTRRILAAGAARISRRRKVEKNNYQRFQEILTLNNKSLELIVDMGEVLQGRAIANLDSMARRIRTMSADVAVMADNLIRITGGRYTRLPGIHRELGNRIEVTLPPERKPAGDLIIPINGSRMKDYRLIGTKMANLAEVWWRLVGVEIPRGFVITTAAFANFLSHNDLWEPVDRLEYLAARNPEALEAESKEIVLRIEDGEIPKELEKSVISAIEEQSQQGEVLYAVRSSAIAEDREASHAGVYRSELCVQKEAIFDAYRKVLASSYSPNALLYRSRYNLPPVEGSMAVGCMAMVDARCSGILFTRDYQDPSADRIVLSVLPELSDRVASGEKDAEEILLEGPDFSGRNSATISADELYSLAKTSRLIEGIFGRPQDIEWALDKDGKLIILQSRPLVLAGQTKGLLPENILRDIKPIMKGGIAACRGAASGPVYLLSQNELPAAIPDGSVVVARKAWPSLVSAMPQIAAIISEVGSPTGHMAILAREASLPCIVGLPGALSTLRPEQMVTVDAQSCSIYDGALPISHPTANGAKIQTVGGRHSDEEILQDVACLVVPLNLTDPASPDFKPESCRSLHDMIRFIHEKVFEAMFHFGDMVLEEQDRAVSLAAALPFPVLVYDLGGAITEREGRKSEVRIEEIASPPMRSFLKGLTDPRVRWDQPRPLSTRGFLSVVGESMAGPPADQRDLGRTSFAVASDKYLNFSTKAGYHFSTIDTYCGQNVNMNYIQFRFMGGGAAEERRARRIRFLSKVLIHLEFQPQEKGETLVARLNKYDCSTILEKLEILGRLTLVARQLDMLMDSEASPNRFAEMFIADRMEFF